MITVCVATNRPEFANWLAFNYAQLECTGKALSVVCDYEPQILVEALREVGCTDARVARATGPHRTAGALFDAAMRRASPESRFLAFRSDDSWWHPKSLTWLRETFICGTPCIGYSFGWFVDLFSEKCVLFRTEVPIVATSLYDAKAREIPWGSEEKASDTTWQKAVARRFGPGSVMPLRKTSAYPHHLWLCHGRNLNDRSQYKYDTPLRKVMLGVEEGYAMRLAFELARLRESLEP